MRHIFYILFLSSIIFGNSELDSYLKNKELEHHIIKDAKNQIVVIDLLDTENKMIIFSKNKNKVFHQKLYFCEDNSRMTFTDVEIFNNQLVAICTITNVAPSTNFIAKYYFDLPESYALTEIIKLYYDIESDSMTNEYQFIPKINIPTLYDFKDKNFANDYLSKHYKDFIETTSLTEKTILPKQQPLYSSPNINSKTKMYLIKGDTVEILEEKDDWLYILFKGKKEIKAWIPKDAIE